MVKSLTVYKASAGSGKTFALAIQYIKLLVKNPQAYRNILAVTFTNKATEEMKTRTPIWNKSAKPSTLVLSLSANGQVSPSACCSITTTTSG